MALSTATATIDTSKAPDVSERYITYYGTVAISAAPGTYATGGLALSFNVAGLVNASAPVEVVFRSTAGAATKYSYDYVPAATPTIANGKIAVYTGDAEVAAGATPAGVSGDTIWFKAKFKKGT